MPRTGHRGNEYGEWDDGHEKEEKDGGRKEGDRGRQGKTRARERQRERVEYENELEQKTQDENDHLAMRAAVEAEHEIKLNAIKIEDRKRETLEADKIARESETARLKQEMSTAQLHVGRSDQIIANLTHSVNQNLPRGGGQNGGTAECFKFRDTGHCNFGATCRFLHGGAPAQGTPPWQAPAK